MVKKKKMWSVPDKVKGPKFSIKKEKYAMLILNIETAVYEMFMITRRELTDQEVIKALERLADLARQSKAPEKSEEGIAPYLHARMSEYIKENPDYSPEEVVDTLKELTGSVKTRHDMGKGPQAYLHFLEGFLNEMGINVQMISPPDEE